MTWRDYALARQYLAEIRIGTQAREKGHVEDAQAKRSKASIKRRK